MAFHNSHLLFWQHQSQNNHFLFSNQGNCYNTLQEMDANPLMCKLYTITCEFEDVYLHRNKSLFSISSIDLSTLTV